MKNLSWVFTYLVVLISYLVVDNVLKTDNFNFDDYSYSPSLTVFIPLFVTVILFFVFRYIRKVSK